MAETTKIEWTDCTFNPWIGCTKVHEGCRHCYAEADMDHRRGRARWGPQGTRSVTSESYWKQPLAWNRKAEKEGRRLKVFCASLADVFEDWGGPMSDAQGRHMVHTPHGWHPEIDEQLEGASRVTMSDVRARLFALMDATPNLDWLLLTKRPENILRMWPERRDVAYIPEAGRMNDYGLNRRENVWLLTSVSDQASADKQIPELMHCRNLSPVLGLSIEPLLGPINLNRKVLIDDGRVVNFVDPLTGRYCFNGRDEPGMDSLDWIIVGGESGPQARPMHPDWVRTIRDQCQAAGVPFFFKQWGEWRPEKEYGPTGGVIGQLQKWTIAASTDGKCIGRERWRAHSLDGNCYVMDRVGKSAAGRLLDGREWNEMPVAEVRA